MAGIVTVTLNPCMDITTSVERLEPEHKLRCEAERRDPGGGGVNVARVVQRLGGDVVAIYPCGGAIGRLLNDCLAAERIRIQTIAIDGITRESFTVLDRSSGSAFRFVLPGPPLNTATFESVLEALDAVAPAPSFVVLSGSLPPGAPTDAYAQLAGIASRRGARVALDASGAALKSALDAGVYLVKPSLRELEEFTGQTLPDIESAAAAATTVVASGRAAVVIVTMGLKGALMVTPTQTVFAEAIPVEVVSTVGAGDSFMGAVIYCLDRGNSLENAFRFGVAAATASVLVPGTQLCSREDTLRFVKSVCVRVLR